MTTNIAFKKWVHTSTALVFLFQQISPAFAMEPPEKEVQRKRPPSVMSDSEDDKELLQALQASEATAEADAIQLTILHNASEFGISHEIKTTSSPRRDSRSALTSSPPLSLSPPLRRHYPLSEKSPETVPPQISISSHSLPPDDEAVVNKTSSNVTDTSDSLSDPASQSLPLPEELTSSQRTLQELVLESTEAIPDRFSSLIGEIRKTFAEAPMDLRSTVERKLPNLVKDSYSLYPWAFLRDEDELRESPVLTPDHHGFRRVNEVMKVLEELTAYSTIPPTLLSKLQQLQGEYGEYIKTLCSLTLEKRGSLLSPVFLQGDLLGGRSYLVSKSLAYKLLSMGKHGIPEKKNTTGSSIVTHVEHIYAKQNLLKERENKQPEGSLNPGMEWAMSAFHHLLIGKNIVPGLVPSALLILSQVPVEGNLSPEKETEKKQISIDAKNHDIGERDRKEIINRLYEDDTLKSAQNYSLQITPEVEGEFLSTFLERALQDPSLFDSLDLSQVQGLILSSFLLTFGDAKKDNLMVTFPDAQGKRKIISIDNDWALESFILEERPGYHVLGARNLLFFIPVFMDQFLDTAVKDRFLSHSSGVFLLRWLRALHHHNERYEALEKAHPTLKDADPHQSLHLKLRPGMAKELLERFAQLQDKMLLNPEVKLQDLFATLSPLTALYCQDLVTQETDVLKAFEKAYNGQAFFEDVLGPRLSQYYSRGITIQEGLKKETTPLNAYKERTQSLLEAVQEVLDSIDFQALTPQEGLQTLEEAASSFPSILRDSITRNNSLMASFLPLLRNSMSLPLVKLFVEVVPELLTQVDERGYSLLHRAIEARMPENIIAYLLEKGMNPDLPTQSKPPVLPLSPLDIACMAYEPHLPSAFAVLIKAGARIVTPQLALQFYQKLMSFLSSSSNEERGSSSETLLSSFLTLLERNQEIAWEFSLFHLLPEVTQDLSEDLPIKTATRGERVIPGNLREQLFKDGKIIRRNTHGKRDVGIIEKTVHGIPLRFYVKEYPELPGLEEAVGSFMRRLFGFGAPYTELIRIGNIPYLVSQEIRGPTAKTVLKKTPQFFDDPNAFDPYFTSAQILMNMLINPEDGIFPNYIVEELPATKTHRLIGIDNDHAFVPGVAKEEPVPGLFSKPEPVVQVKTILFCLDHMLKAVHPDVRVQFLKVDIGEFLEGWLRDLRERNALYDELFNEPGERLALLPKKPDDPTSKGTYVGIPFQDNAIKDLYQKMSALQSLLQESPQLTHLQLLSKVEPHVGHRYGKGFSSSRKSFKDRIQFVDGLNSHLSISPSGRLFKSMNIPLKESLMETSAKDATKAHDYRPNRALEELKEIRKQHGQDVFSRLQTSGEVSSSPAPALKFTHLKTLILDEDLEKILAQHSYKEITETDQRALFEVMKGRKFQNLILRNAYALKRIIFQTFQLEYLLTLNLEGCLALSDRIFPLIAEKAPSLESLNLAHITIKMKEIGKQRKGILDATPLYIFFPSLRYLNISYGGVKTVLVNAPKLKVFNARAAKDLQTLDIRQQSESSLGTPSASALRKVDLREVQSLSLDSYIQFRQSHPHLSKVQTDGARNLSLIPRIPLQDVIMLIEADNLRKFNEHLKRGENNHPEAQLQLTEMYAKGHGVKQNFEIALEWYIKAAEKSHEAAKLLYETYDLFLKGVLIYKPNKENDIGKIELRIADLTNPLEGEFDLSKCGDAAQYLSINTGYRKGKRLENERKVEIWFAPHFLIKNNLQGSASHFKDIMGSWDASKAPVATFFTWGDWDVKQYEYIINENFDIISDGKNLYEKHLNVQTSFFFNPSFTLHIPQYLKAHKFSFHF